MSDRLHLITTFAGLVLFAGSFGAASLRADIVQVTPDNLGVWSTSVTPGSGVCPCGSVNFVNGPGSPPLGTGSVNLQTTPGNGDTNVEVSTGVLDGMALSSISTLSYSTYMTTNNGQQFPYLALLLNLEGNSSAGVDGFVVFEPPYQTPTYSSALNEGPTALNTWQNWNALAGAWEDENLNGNNGNGSSDCNPGATEPGLPGVCLLATIENLYPNAVIVSDSSGKDSLQIQLGQASLGDTFNGNVDDVAINGTTYDFEAGPSTPEPGTLALLSGGLVLLAAARRKLQPRN